MGIFSHSTKWIDLTQFLVALSCAAAIFSLARMLKQDINVSIFVSLLFLFVPIVITQSGSNYIDLTVCLFFLLALYFNCQFYWDGRKMYLILSGVATGLLVGTKYHMLPLAGVLQLLIFPRLFREKKILRGILYASVVAAFGGIWYFRNFLLLGNPIFPVLSLRPAAGYFFPNKILNYSPH